MGRTYRHDKDWGSKKPRSKTKVKKQRGMKKIKPLNTNDSSELYYDELEVEMYEEELYQRRSQKTK